MPFFAISSPSSGNATQLQANPVSGDAPDTNEVLTWNGSAWVPAAGTPGPTGPSGADGKNLTYGSGAPSNGFGNSGDWYIDTAGLMLYGPKASGVWPAGVALQGPAGDAGPQGETGPAGTTDFNELDNVPAEFPPEDHEHPAVVVALAYAATTATDASLGNIFDLTLTGNVTLSNPTNPVNGKTLRWRISQDGTGSRAVTLGAKFNIPSSGSDPLPWSTAANAMDILAATYHEGRDQWDVVAFVPGY